jgi:D-glycero-D-manno-heptose 1,7-bisphosphate phosphatase
MSRKAVFVDRDGTINQDVHYLSDPEELRMLPTVPEGIRLLNENGFLVVIVTNQSGIARGLLTRETLIAIHQRMKSELRVVGAGIDAVYYCPHHPDDRCACRKPGTALLERAIVEHDIDPTCSFFIGDRMTDIEAGQKVGCTTVLVPEDSDLVEKERSLSSASPDFEADRFLDGVMWILDKASKSQTTKSQNH